MAKCYILASLSPVLQKQHESMQTAGDMIFSLQEMFQQTTRPARQQAIKKLMNAKQAEGTPVREHMLKVMEYLHESLDLGAEIDGQTQVDMVLETLSSSFSQFKLNFNMNKMKMSLPMLMKELQSAEQIMGKEKQVHFVKVSNSGPKKPKNKKKYGCIYLMRRKSEAFDKFKEFKYLTDNGIVTQLSAPRTPQQNGDHLSQYQRHLMRCGLDARTRGGYFYNPDSQKVFISTNARFLEEDCINSKLRRSGRVSRPPERFMYFGESVLAVSDELEPDPTSYEEAVSDADADHWLKAMESELESMYSNEVWDLTAFLNGHLDESIYMMQPIGFVAESQQNMVCKLKKSIYGLKTLALSQATYIEKILVKYTLHDSKKGLLPFRHGVPLSKDNFPKTEEEKREMSKVPYASVVGSLMYAMLCTRPDICYAVGLVSSNQSNPGLHHWTAVKHIFKYLRRTKDYMLVCRSDEIVPVGYTDSVFQEDKDSRRSTSGYVVTHDTVVSQLCCRRIE
ncbi:uncharacterized protein LOC119985521 [Tripterygium wilfordii]|uniref:uncharacterized protein LOC119985521 n=1 Tax=Tripterygium wilfordii TaxID=458696 RepID=UPI0018F8561D|nr:uncharacterized protein LOC119985521 [Tripterygium wilfordii]